jgi:MFS family permease
LKAALFRHLWIATIVSNIGTWMQDVGAGWLMTSLSTSPSLVALVEAADSLAIMLLALPAGAIADIVDRRRLLLFVHLYLLVVASLLAVLTVLGLTTPWMLLAFIFALGVGAAMVMPAWAAIVQDLVSASELPSAIALDSVAINVSRAIGPAIAGLLVSIFGPWLVFGLNALSYVGVIVVLLQWRRTPIKSALPAERFFKPAGRPSSWLQCSRSAKCAGAMALISGSCSTIPPIPSGSWNASSTNRGSRTSASTSVSA